MPISYVDCSFGYRRGAPVVSSLDFTFPTGNTVFLGPNGAGKSTLLKLAASALSPTSGTVGYAGLETGSRRALREYRRRIAWMPQNIECVAGLTAREQVAYVGWLKGLSKAAAWEKAVSALTRVELGKHADRKVSELSGGQLRRVGVAQSLVHDAEVLLLDEPTAGMDPRQRRVFHDVLEQLRGHVDVVLSTHDVADLESAYDSVVVLLDGEVEFHGTIPEFLAMAPRGTPPGRLAEAAYHALTESGSLCDS
ncbi:ABC transporter ATP-binding protein [Streptomyces sp. AD55]|uniref:ABC transporter ATP-binding protein n=1 Tax=Streptomyces sp. AD55 TaxID=3242895 RepID=UPI0035292A2C